jgi:arylsulfatase A-like enzyme
MAVIRWLLFVVAVTTGALAAAPKATPKTLPSNPKSPSIVLITLDTTRADRMGFLGSERGLTPNLDALAKQSAVFTHAYAQVPLTTASHATILTGTYPQFHLVNDLVDPLVADLPSGPEILRAHGYRTAAFVGSIILNGKKPYAPGFDRGFDTYDSGFHNEGPGEDRYSTVQRRGEKVVAHALAWLAKHPKGPFFVWVHLYDAHAPYDPPEPYKSRYASAPYDGGIAYEDAVVGKLFRELKVRGLFNGAVIAVMADHGESLGAHGEDTHGIFLYDETIRVPLLIKLPQASGGGKRIENRVELTDILPTLLQEAGIAIPKEVQGESLLGLMKGEAEESKSAAEAWRHRPAYAQSVYPHTEYGWSALRSLRTEKYLYVQAPRRELYDQAADPNADHNLATSSPAVADTLAGQLETIRQKTSSQRETVKSALDPAAQAQLGALGYMASGKDVSGGTPLDQGADPKDKIEISNMIHQAEILQQDAHSDESIALLEQAIAKEPGLPLYSKLGDWMMRKQEYQKAVPVLRKAMEMDRDSPITHLQLAKALMRTGDFEAAVPELEITEAKLPQLVDAHLLLQMAYIRTNRATDVIRECKIVLQFFPDHYPSYLILGRFLQLSGETNGAISNLKKAVALEPKAPDPHLILADVYDHLGRKADAARERAEAKRLGAIPGDQTNPAPDAQPGSADKH